LEAAHWLSQTMQENENDLMLVDTALVGRPQSHMIPERG
jgi:hypothetical protein